MKTLSILLNTSKLILTLAGVFGFNSLFAQSASISGKVVTGESPVAFANVIIKELNKGISTNIEGYFQLGDLPAGTYSLEVSALGFIPFIDSITLTEGQILKETFILREDVLNLSQVVVTGSRNRVKKYDSPVIMHTIDNRTLESTQAINIADGLNFSPGLRIENNCQNCGFTQLRMNGLDGPYSQVLINSRPVFSALAGVYGLEMLPANMIDRVEVLRGGGSVLYGGNAIAGTVNIITNDPYQNTFEVGINQSLINGEASDRTVNFNGSVVSEDLNKGISFFGFNRNREHWDANDDGFSEIVELQNNTFGFDAFYNLNERGKLKLGAYYINEFRRGGNKFDLAPHQTDVTEQLQHDILSANLSYEQTSKNRKHKIFTYASLQQVNRDSYYGGGGRVLAQGDTLTPDDILAINAYGDSRDFSSVGGVQYNYFINKYLSLTTGSEFIYNHTVDEMPGYERSIDQNVSTWGTFAELEIKPIEKLTFLLGGRYDYLTIDGEYRLSSNAFKNERQIGVFVPRASAMYRLKDNLKLRASFAQGYRGPQAFDEDLHIETVGGAALFIQLDPNLEVERSNSATLSLNYDQYLGRNQMNFVIEGFYTELNNPFINAGQTELPNGVAVITKRNGSGATVSGVNLEANIAIGSKLVLQSGATLQTALFAEEEELWSPEEPSEEDPAIFTNRILRTPNQYGFFSLVYNPIESVSIAYSGVITGSMNVAHVIDAETERTVIKETPTFFENNMKATYTLTTKDKYRLMLFGGVQNIFNSYQNDFDIGAERDAGYVYGPLRPRTYFMGLKFGLN